MISLQQTLPIYIAIKEEPNIGRILADIHASFAIGLLTQSSPDRKTFMLQALSLVFPLKAQLYPLYFNESSIEEFMEFLHNYFSNHQPESFPKLVICPVDHVEDIEKIITDKTSSFVENIEFADTRIFTNTHLEFASQPTSPEAMTEILGFLGECENVASIYKSIMGRMVNIAIKEKDVTIYDSEDCQPLSVDKASIALNPMGERSRIIFTKEYGPQFPLQQISGRRGS